MKDIKKQVEEANEIAKVMRRDITFSAIYVSKFDTQSVNGISGVTLGIEDPKTEIEIKVENFDLGT